MGAASGPEPGSGSAGANFCTEPGNRSVALGIGGLGGALGFGIDFDDSDYEDSDDEQVPQGGPRGGGLQGQSMSAPLPGTGAGGVNSRPMVGGFAAAAYEAARAHHYQTQAKMQQAKNKQQPAPQNRRPQNPY